MLPNLTPLRFFLALMVIVFHVPQFFKNRGLAYFDGLPIFHKGTEAVYVFFVLSGFLIIRLLFIEKEVKGGISIKNFYMRRVLRIFPLYYLVLILGVLYYHLVLPMVGFEFDNDYSLTNALFFFVFFLPNVAGYLYHPGGALEILWSIGIEEQFYIVVAPVLFFIKKKHIIPFLVIFTVGYSLFYAYSGFEFLSQFKLLYFYFSMGGLLAVLHYKYHIADRLSKTLKWIIIILFLIYFNIDVSLPVFWIHTINMLLFGGTILALSAKPPFEITNKYIHYLGTISYGIYMYHALAMQCIGLLFLIINKYYALNNVLIVAVVSNLLVIIVTVIMAHISYKYFEAPILKLKRNYK